MRVPISNARIQTGQVQLGRTHIHRSPEPKRDLRALMSRSRSLPRRPFERLTNCGKPAKPKIERAAGRAKPVPLAYYTWAMAATGPVTSRKEVNTRVRRHKSLQMFRSYIHTRPHVTGRARARRSCPARLRSRRAPAVLRHTGGCRTMNSLSGATL